MDSKVALDTDVLCALVQALDCAGGAEPDAEVIAAVRIYYYITNPFVPPTVAADTEQTNWKQYHFNDIPDPDEFFLGCVKGMANRYLDYHPDPRDCHVVAEVECAKVGVLLTQNADLVHGLSGRSEIITITYPSHYWRDAHIARGTPPRLAADAQKPLASAGWWRW